MAETYCCIVGSYHAGGDCTNFMPCLYVGCCGNLPEKFTFCGGCNCCGGNENPKIEIPCLLLCFLWPVVYPCSLLFSWIFSCCCRNAIYVGECCFNCGECCCCCHDCVEKIHGPEPPYNRGAWYDEGSLTGGCFSCCNKTIC
eukprot:TRINITY_DN7395_c0_g1_i1.p1 TRINITY_DN7395_c0_g1~~TRINITY_DN7395_c0_g1_i1.p1  ORF type:complete len:142 (-),score=13.04 TRINITY_DN7395_c0_g1_i1:120-545(-)